MPDHTERVRLGSSGLEPTRLAFGGGPIGNMFAPIPEPDADHALQTAWDLGIRLFDTAPFYGYGLSEQRVGRMLADKPRDEVVVTTKVGKLLREDATVKAEQHAGPGGTNMFQGAPDLNVEYDYSGEGVKRSLEESLERLGLERVDALNVHDPEEFVEEALDGALPALAELRSQGVISSIGVGINHADVLERFVRNADLDAVLLAGRYSLLDQSALDTGLFDAVRTNDVGIMLGGVYNSGILAKPEPGATFNYTTAPEELIERAKAIQAVCDRYDVPLMAAAIQFPLANPAVSLVLTGVRSAAEIEQNVQMFNHPIPTELWQELRAEGLIDERAFLPA